MFGYLVATETTMTPTYDITDIRTLNTVNKEYKNIVWAFNFFSIFLQIMHNVMTN